MLMWPTGLAIIGGQKWNGPHGKRMKTTRPKNDGGEEESTKRHVYVEPGVQIDFVKDLRAKYDATQRDDKTDKAKQLFWTRIAAGLLLLAAGFAGWQDYLTRAAIRDAREQFVKDQRPYVWIFEYIDPKNVHINENEKMWINLPLINYGKSPAVRAKSTGKIFMGPDAMKQADKWFNDLGTGPILTEPDAVDIFPPGIPSDREKPFGGYSTLMTDKVLKSGDVDYILHTEQPIAIVMRTQYYDLAGNRYWSDMCMSRFATGSYPRCLWHNELH
jgi:hypothetical protein